MTTTEAHDDDPDFEEASEADASAIPEGRGAVEHEDEDESKDPPSLRFGEAGEDEGGTGGGVELYRGRPAWLNYWRSLLLGAAPVVAGIVLWEKNGWILFGGLLFALAAYSYICVMRSMYLYVVTPRRVEVIFGLITKNSHEVRVQDIRAINVKKAGFKGLIGVGTVEFSSAGGGDVEVSFADVWKPLRVKGLVRRLQDGGA